MKPSDEIIIRRENGQLIVNDLGMKVLDGDFIAYYKIDELLEAIHGKTSYPLGRDIFVKMLISLIKEGPLDEDTKKYYKRIVTEVFGPSYDSNIPDMYEAKWISEYQKKRIRRYMEKVS